ncbi:MAG: aldehyde ferredoxin oxidoreductase C-terminal domain-containing protein [Candidatus Methanomethylicia archaeon]
MYGYMGEFLRVDLTKEKITREKIDESVLRKFIGGAGIGIKILYDEVSPEIEWSNPENRLIFATGPLNGTMIGGSGSYCVITKGPLTNGAASSQANGFFGAYLKFCGFDGIIIQGASKKYIYIYIDDENIEFREATHLVGKGTYETEKLIKQELKKKEIEISVASIGPAGENLVKFAGIFSDTGHAAPHNGVGAVMGSKKLKAIVITRGKHNVKVKNKEELIKIAQKMLNDVKTLDKKTYNWGTLWANTQGYEENWLPIKNYTTNVWLITKNDLNKWSPEYIRGYFKSKPKPCWACQIHHCHMIEFPEGSYAGELMEEPEYEQWASWGPLIDNKDIIEAALLSKEVDNLGMDTNEASWIIAFTIECCERGILKKEDINGLEMRWGDTKSVKLLLNLIAKRKGIGDILAEGVMRASKYIGKEAPNIAIFTKKGNTPRSHDHRVRLWEMFDTCVSNTGTLEGPVLGTVGPQDWKEIATLVAKMKGRMQFEDSLVTCRFNTRTNIELLSQAVCAVTGWDFTFEEAIECGRRIVNLYRAFNIRCGITSDLDYPSPRYGSAPPDGPLKGKSLMPYWDKMLQIYYKEMGWDEKSGKPLPETLKKLSLDYVIKDIW